jgi:hypothetical protein
MWPPLEIETPEVLMEFVEVGCVVPVATLYVLTVAVSLGETSMSQLVMVQATGTVNPPTEAVLATSAAPAL